MHVLLCLAAALAAAAPAAPHSASAASSQPGYREQPVDTLGASHEWYPAQPGDTWTWQSTYRGAYTNTVVDTAHLGGRDWFRINSVDEQGATQQLFVRHESGRVYQRTPAGTEFLFVDFSVPPGGFFTVVQGGQEMPVTHTLAHDTLTVLGTLFRNVRQYLHRTPDGGSYDTYFARGIGLVAVVWPGGAQYVRLISANVGGTAFTAAAVAEAASGIATRPLSAVQVENLALLAEVWGFAKYHHPAITAGDADWDGSLFEVMPGVLDAADGAAAAGRIGAWLAELGEPAPCGPCAQLGQDLHLQPELDWIRDVARLGAELSARLERMHRNRPVHAEQRYVTHMPNVGNPNFDGEASYAELTAPDAGYRLLALFRYWNIIRYWFPYRDLIDDDWDGVLREFIPELMNASGGNGYRLAMLRLAGRIQDTHASMPRAAALRPPTGGALLPVIVRFIEGHAVVTSYSHPVLGPASGLHAGDILLRIDSAPIDSLVAAWTPYYPASNEAARLAGMAPSLTRGAAGPTRLVVRRGDATLDLTADRVPTGQLDLTFAHRNDLPGDAFQWLDEEVAYLRLSGTTVAGVPGYMERAASARVLVVDIRNYPQEFVVFALGGRLVRQPTPFALFTMGDASNPGAFRWGPPVSLQPVSPHFPGTVVVLVDESSISQSEYTAMALRAGFNTVVVGSTTAGADGNVSRIPLPGGLDTWITGIGVFYPERTPTQRMGIIPDLEVRPTVAGIRAGRDEVLEAGVSHALGRAWRRPAN